MCGRAKDVIVIAGNNIYPTDIERAACAVPGVRAGNAVAVRIDAGDGREGFAVLAESAQAGDAAEAERIRAEITRAVIQAVGYNPRAVLVLPPGTPAQDAVGQAATPQGGRIVRPRRCRIRRLHRATGGTGMSIAAIPPAILIDDLRIDRARPHRDRHHERVGPGRHHYWAAGPSGCGKTTLMRAIVGAQRITAGSITVFGEAAGARSLRRRIGYVTQSPSIYPDLTTVENVRYFAAMYGVGSDRVREVIDAVGLTAKKTRAGRKPVRRTEGTGVARVRARLRSRPAHPRRTDGRAGPGAARRTVGTVPFACRPRKDPARLQPCNG